MTSSEGPLRRTANYLDTATFKLGVEKDRVVLEARVTSVLVGMLDSGKLDRNADIELGILSFKMLGKTVEAMINCESSPNLKDIMRVRCPR